MGDTSWVDTAARPSPADGSRRRRSAAGPSAGLARSLAPHASAGAAYLQGAGGGGRPTVAAKRAGSDYAASIAARLSSRMLTASATSASLAMSGGEMRATFP